MLEEKIERLTAEIVKLRESNEKLAGGKATGGGSATTEDAGKGKGSKGAAGKKSKHKPDEVKAAVIKVKDEVSKDAAQKIIKDAGCDGLAELQTKPETFDAVMAACAAALAGDGDDDDNDDDDDL